jgi:uncharacterized protein (DUF488 family)
LFSIGHSSHDLPRLVELLQQVGVTAVADVRSSPFSQRHPQFNRPDLEWGLKQQGIAYLFLGDFLGGRPRQASMYDPEGRADYERMRLSAPVQVGLDCLCRALDRDTLAMLCAEEDPLDCHRGLMITPALLERGISPEHLRGNGSVETTPAMEDRLLAVAGVGSGILDGLFGSLISAEERRQFLRQAYRLQARRKAFRLKPGDSLLVPPDADDEGVSDGE